LQNIIFSLFVVLDFCYFLKKAHKNEFFLVCGNSENCGFSLSAASQKALSVDFHFQYFGAIGIPFFSQMMMGTTEQTRSNLCTFLSRNYELQLSRRLMWFWWFANPLMT
jgi:hypothetical protein